MRLSASTTRMIEQQKLGKTSNPSPFFGNENRITQATRDTYLDPAISGRAEDTPFRFSNYSDLEESVRESNNNKFRVSTNSYKQKGLKDESIFDDSTLRDTASQS